METKIKTKKFRSLMWIGTALAFFAVAIAVLASWLLYQQTIELLTENLRQRLLSISITQAANIDSNNLLALQTEEDWKKPEWSRVVSRLKKAKEGNPNIVFMYIFRRSAEDPSKMEFVADAESINPYANSDEDPTNDVDANGDGIIDPEGADYLQWPGQPYDEAVDIPETVAAFDGPLTATELYEDSYGQVLSGYAPIKDDAGNVVAILATDIKANDFLTVTRQTLYPFLVFITFLIVIITFLSATLVFLWKRRAEEFAELDRLKDEFLSVATHQLRAPITAIRGYAANMLDGTYGPVVQYFVEPLSVIKESTRLMASSIDDYLNISRIEQGRMKYEVSTFDIANLAKKVVHELTPVASSRKLSLTYSGEESVNVRADVGKMGQVITNLIDNAIKYTQSGSIEVAVEKRGNFVRLTVKDTGIGISQKDISALFEKFKRARDANRINTTGTGLGLYVAKMLVLGNGGKIWVESDGEGKGSRFIFELPA